QRFTMRSTWLLRSVTGRFFLLGSAKGVQIRNLPKRRLRSVPAPVRCSPRSDGIPAGLVLPVVITPAQREVLFGPDNLRTNLEARRFESTGNLRSVGPGVPHITDIAWEQPIGRRPIHPVVVGNGSGLSLLPQPRSLAPARVIVHSIRWVRHHKQGSC